MRIAIPAFALLLSTSCASWHGPPASFPLSHLGPSAESKEDCIALGGTWARLSTESLDEQCSVPTTDGGTPCTDHAQCQGLCVAVADAKPGARVTGQCRSSYSLAGRCDIRVANGRAEAALCID